MAFSVRTYKSSDYDAILDVWKRTNMGGAHRGDNQKTIENTIAIGGELFVLCEDFTEKIVGTSWITNDSRRLYLHHFGILPEYQGKGLSHLLMESSMEFATHKKLQIKLEVHKDNEIARKLYEKYKFKFLGDYEVFIVRDI